MMNEWNVTKYYEAACVCKNDSGTNLGEGTGWNKIKTYNSHLSFWKVLMYHL